MAQDAKLALVADDDDQVRELVSAVLESAGYEVRMATNAADAEHALRLNLDNLSLVVLDVDMAPGSGLDVLELVRRLRPELATIMMSGERGYRALALKMGARAFVTKPFAVPALMAELRALEPNAGQSP